MTSEEKTIDLIRKLLNLSKSPNEHEAKLALERAQEMLFKHNLSISQIETADIPGATNGDDVIVEERVHVANYHQLKEWKMSLGFGMAQYFFCKGLSGIYNFYFIGRKSDVEVVTETYRWVVEQAERLATESFEAYKKTPEYRSYPVHGKRWKASYLEGLASGIRSILGKQWRELRDASEQSKALVIVRGEEVDTFVAKKYPKLGHHNNDYGAHSGAYMNGHRDASKVQISARPKVLNTVGMIQS